MKIFKRKHRTKVAKRNMFGSRMWWLTCTCGYLNGWNLKQNALDNEARHLAEAASGDKRA